MGYYVQYFCIGYLGKLYVIIVAYTAVNAQAILRIFFKSGECLEFGLTEKVVCTR